MKTEYGYKLFERKGDQIFPLFIDKSSPVPVGEWIPAENHPTKGFAKRPGWHIGMIPDAPWLKGANGKYKSRFAKGERVWCVVEFDRTINYQPEVDALSKKCFTDRIRHDSQIHGPAMLVLTMANSNTGDKEEQE